MITKKVILDVDPGIDDAIALTMALFDPQLEVVAVTATGGNVSPDQATRNVQAIIEQLDPPRWPRIGLATMPDDGLPANRTHIFGSDGLGNSNFTVAELHHRHPAEKVICDEVHAAPEEITIITLGPLTNLCRAFQRDPKLQSSIGQIVIQGGAGGGRGDVTPAAEFNIYSDPLAARMIFRSPTTKILVPLEVTRQVVFDYDLLERLPDETSRAGRFLRKLLPFLFRSQRQALGVEGIQLHETIAVVAALHPELFAIEMTAGDVETSGELTKGVTVFDRRRRPEWRPNLGLATGIDTTAVADCILRSLAAAGAASKDA